MAKNVPHTEVAPPLPATSVDFNALHEACLAGKSHDEALAAAGVEFEQPEAPAEPEAPAPEEPAAPSEDF